MRDRVVFGIRNSRGDLVGFTGRAAPGDIDAPKWLNTPTTAVFTKGELLFGYTENRDRLANGATPVRVEGVMDALAVTLVSDGRAVGLAPLGTALTAAQAGTFAAAASQHLVLHATDDDPAGLKAAGRDYWLLTARGVDVRKLILTDGEHGFNDPADAYRAAQPSLAAALDATSLAPPLAGHLVGEMISHNRDVLAVGNLGATIEVTRQIGTIVAAAPPDQRQELTTAAAAMLADATGDDQDHYLELIGNATDEVSPSWNRHPSADATSSNTIVEHTRARLAAASATLADLRQPAADPGQLSETGSEGETVATDPATTHRESRRDDQRHDRQPDKPGLEQ